MAARAHSLFDIQVADQEIHAEPRSAIARLAILHAEAEETARLANLLGRSLYAAITLPVLAAIAIAFTSGVSAAPCTAWAVLVVAASLAIARAYGTAIGQPFERAALHAFSQDLTAVLLYAGFAWGAGAFLVLPGGAPIGAALLFASAPALALSFLLRERNAILLFLAPVTALTSFACVLRPFSGGALDAALVIVSCAVVGGAIVAAERRKAKIRARAIPDALQSA